MFPKLGPSVVHLARRKDLRLSDRKDPAALMVAKLTIELAKQREFTAESLRARVSRK